MWTIKRNEGLGVIYMWFYLKVGMRHDSSVLQEEQWMCGKQHGGALLPDWVWLDYQDSLHFNGIINGESGRTARTDTSPLPMTPPGRAAEPHGRSKDP